MISNKYYSTALTKRELIKILRVGSRWLTRRSHKPEPQIQVLYPQLKSYLLNNEGYINQIITENEFNHLVSVVKRERFDSNALRAVNELRNKVRKQEKFLI